MEKISFEEARQWFWTRTVIWTIPACLISAIGCFLYIVTEDLTPVEGSRLWVAIWVGIAVTLLGLLGASISMQLPWMRLGWRKAFAINGITTGVISAVAALCLCGIAWSFIDNNPDKPLSIDVKGSIYDLMIFAIAAAGFWGFTLGTWFAARRDKYFIEPI